MATPTHVQAVSVQSTTSVTTLTSPTFTSTTGNLLAVVWGDGTGATYGATPISDNKANTWAPAVARASSGTVLALAQSYAKNIAGGAGHTVTQTATAADFLCLAVEEVSGADTAAPLDQHPAGATSAGGSNPHNAAAMTPTVAGTLAVAGMTHAGISTNTFAATGTGTVRTSQTNTSNQPIGLSTDTLSTTAAVTEGFNLTPNDSVPHVVVVANFIGAASAAPAMPRQNRRSDPWRAAQQWAAIR